MPAILTAAERAAALATLPGWQARADRDAIEKTYVLRDFAEAFGVMARIAVTAEGMNHHPEWSNVYNRLQVVLSTHEAGGVTERDIALARAFEQAVGR
jgi:4a-hydroxytetrahydrobiopterin dehydratase